jgi:peroxiredoxin
MKRLGIVLIFLGFVSILSAQGGSKVYVGDPAPQFFIQQLNGETLSREDLVGKITLINFFAPWSEESVEQLGDIDKKIWGKINNPKFNMLSVGYGLDAGIVMQFNGSYNYKFPLGADPRQGNFKAFQTKALLPLNIVMNERGTIIYYKAGGSGKDLKKMLQLIKAELGK